VRRVAGQVAYDAVDLRQGYTQWSHAMIRVGACPAAILAAR
jgi:hypothetical protein